MHVVPEPARPFTAREECAVLRAGLRRRPQSAQLRLRLARRLNQLDAFDECIALFDDTAPGQCDLAAAVQAAFALLAREAPGDNSRAEQFCARAAQTAANDRERARALADQAKALTRQGRPAAARDLLLRALELDPHSILALKRLAAPLLQAGEADAVLALTDGLLGRGVGHCRLFAVRSAALAQLGRIDEARELLGLEDFLHQRTIEAPAGWDSLQSFNAAVADEVMANAGFRYGRYGTASEKTWRVDTPAAGKTPAVQALLAGIAQTAAARVAALGEREHPWLAARPANAVLRSWSVVTGAEGREQLHNHPYGWMSGGYYPQVPAAVAEGRGPAGCLAFALPEGTFGEAAARAFGEVLVRPREGLLTLFPSHAYHRTHPHGADGRRICIAFDIVAA